MIASDLQYTTLLYVVDKRVDKIIMWANIKSVTNVKNIQYSLM